MLQLKVLLADAAQRGRKLTKADISDAYPKGHRDRPTTYMCFPSSIDSKDEDANDVADV